MNRQLTGTVIFILLSLPVQAAEQISKEQIHQVMLATDTAAMNRDTLAIGMYLGDSFEKLIEFVYKEKWMAKVKLDKADYLELIDAGWASVERYDYQRDDIVINLMPDGSGGESHSTITEIFVQDGEEMTSKYRESATYTMEQGWPVITQISGHTLVGDTTPQWQESSPVTAQAENTP
jgi:hypothetical protein